MSQPIEIPKILQDRQGPSIGDTLKLKSKEFRRNVSKKMGRFLADISFDKSSINVNDEDRDDNPDKFAQDENFATYEPNLRHTHHQEMLYEHGDRVIKHRERVYKAKRLGSLVMTMPGLHAVGEAIGDHKRSQSRLKQDRTEFIKRNGTMKSRMRDRYIKHKRKYPD